MWLLGKGTERNEINERIVMENEEPLPLELN